MASFTGHRPEHGFTLIEIMVVMVIIAVVTSFLMLSLDPTGPAERLDTAAKRLDALAGMAADDAILYGREVGLDITPGGYRFLRLGDDGWQPLGGRDSPLRPRKLGDGIVLALIQREADAPRLTASDTGSDARDDKDDEKDDENTLRPEAFFLSSGEGVPFDLELSARGVDHVYHLTGKRNGEIVLERSVTRQ